MILNGFVLSTIDLHNYAGETVVYPGNAQGSISERNAATIHCKHDTVSENQIHSVLSSRFGVIPVTLQLVTRGRGSCLYYIETKSGKSFAIKINLFQDHHSPEYELLFSALVKSCAEYVPVPHTILLDLSGDVIPWPYSLYEWLPGTSLIDTIAADPTGDYSSLFECLGHVTQRIHSIDIRTDGFGAVTRECVSRFLETGKVPGYLHGKAGSFESQYFDTFHDVLDRLGKESLISKRECDYIGSLSYDSVQNGETPVVLHGDLSMGNILIKNNVISGVLDGSAAIGYQIEDIADVYRSLVSLEIYFPGISGKNAFDAFLSGYGKSYDVLFRNEKFLHMLIVKILVHVHILLKKNKHDTIRRYVELLRHYVSMI